MATLSLRDLTTLVRDASAAAQASVAQTLNLNVGSVLRALIDAHAGVWLWLQFLVVQVLGLTRAATSTGADLDTWFGDWFFDRLPARAATGLATFSRTDTTQQAVIPIGLLLKSNDGAQGYQVALDTTNPAWDVGLGAYLIAPSVSSASVPIASITLGLSGNAGAGTIGLIAAPLPFVDAVTNAVALTDGQDAESDADYRGRFQSYIGSLSRATVPAIDFAVSITQTGLTHAVIENTPSVGFFTVVVDDGSGAPSSDLLAAVQANVNLYRPLGSVPVVIGPSVTSVTILLTIEVAPGIVKPNLIGPVVTAISAYVSMLGIGEALRYTRVAQIAYDAAPAGQIVNVSGLSLNGGTSDIVPGATGLVRVATVAVS